MTYARFYRDQDIPVLGPVRLHWDFEQGDPWVYHITSQDEVIQWVLPTDWEWFTVLGFKVELSWYITGQDIRDATYYEV